MLYPTHREPYNLLVVLIRHYQPPKAAILPIPGKFFGDLLSSLAGRFLTRQFLAVGIADALAIFEMKKVPHNTLTQEARTLFLAGGLLWNAGWPISASTEEGHRPV
jgi:hypothetical protein